MTATGQAGKLPVKNGYNTTHATRRWIFWLIVAALVFLFVYAIKAILLPFVVGILAAYFLDPAADRLERAGLSRNASTAVITLGFFSLITLLLIILSPMIYRQLSDFVQMIPQLIDDWRSVIEPKIDALLGQVGSESLKNAKDAMSDASGTIFGKAGTMVTNILASGAALINLVSLLVLTPVVSFYMLRDWDKVVAKVDELLPLAYADTIREQIAIIDDTISGFIRGTLNVMIVLGTFYAIALSVVGLDFAIIIGLIGGVMIIIPYAGTFISGLAAVGMAYLQFDTLPPVLIVLGIFVIGQMLEGYVLTPKLVGEKVGLHPLWLIFGMLAGATLFGFVGIFLAVPVTAVVGVLVRFAMQQYKQSDYYRDTTSAKSSQ